MDLTVMFERLGRRRDVSITLKGVDPATEDGRDEIAAALYHQTRRYLSSTEYTVTIDFTSRQVTVEGGRFGRGMLQVPQA